MQLLALCNVVDMRTLSPLARTKHALALMRTGRQKYLFLEKTNKLREEGGGVHGANALTSCAGLVHKPLRTEDPSANLMSLHFPQKGFLLCAF